MLYYFGGTRQQLEKKERKPLGERSPAKVGGDFTVLGSSVLLACPPATRQWVAHDTWEYDEHVRLVARQMTSSASNRGRGMEFGLHTSSEVWNAFEKCQVSMTLEDLCER